MSETSKEVILNETEKTILDNDTDLNELGFSGRISKEALQKYSKAKLDKLRQMLSTNGDLQELISDYEASAPSEPQVAENPESEMQQEETEMQQDTQVEQKADKQPEESPEKIERGYRSKGMSDLYILMRMLERGYIPTVHDLKFKDPTGKFFGNKINYIKHKGKYTLEGGFLTNGNLNGKFSILNTMLDEKIRGIVVEGIDFEKAQAREFLSQIGKSKVKLDREMIDGRIRNLEALETAIRSGNAADVQRFSDEYLFNSGKSLDKLAREHGLVLQTSKINSEKAKFTSKKDKLNAYRQSAAFQAEEARIHGLNSGSDNIANLGGKASVLKVGEHVNVSNARGDAISLKLKDIKVVGTERIYTVNFEVKNAAGAKTAGKTEVKILADGTIVDMNRKFVFKGNRFSINSEKIINFTEKFKDIELREKKLLQLEAELQKTPQNKNLIKRLKSELGRTKHKLSDAEIKKGAVKHEKIEMRKIKADLDAIELRIDNLKEEAKKQLKELDKKAGKDPAKIQKYRDEGKRLVDDINKEIVDLNKKGINTVAKLDADELLKLSAESKTLKGIKATDTWVNGVMSSKGGKWVGGFAVLTLAWGAKDGAWEMARNGITKENAKDIGDMAVGFLPIVGGINDLYVAASGKDWNNRNISGKERAIRTGFGIIGLIPGAGLILKGGAKVIKGAAGVRVIKAADVALEGTRVAGKIGTYGYLGYSLTMATVNTVEKLPGVGKYRQSIPVKE